MPSKTSIEISVANIDKNGILWLKEESEGAYAWYGIDLSTGVFELDNGLKFYVQWLAPSASGYEEYVSALTPEQKAQVEDDNGLMLDYVNRF